MVFSQGERRYSYADYLSSNEKEKIEIINGEIFRMVPPHSRRHQQILRELLIEFTLYFRENSSEGEAYIAPFDVRLQAENKDDDDVYNFVQPDITIVYDKNKLDERGCKGTPDMIIEILSPSSVKLDRREKYYLYEKVGVKEYWIVDALNEFIEVFLFDENKFASFGVFTKEDTIQVQTIRGFELDLNHIFKN